MVQKVYDTFKSSISSKSKESTADYLTTDEHNVVKNQKEVTETLGSYFTNVNIGGYHVNNLSEENRSEHNSVPGVALGAYEMFKKKKKL